MPRIIIDSDRESLAHLRAEIVTLSEIDGIYTVVCSGDGRDQCPSDLEPGDTWSSLEDCIEAAVRHVASHEQRFCPTDGTWLSPMTWEHDGTGEFVGHASCPTDCGYVLELR